MFDNIGEKIKIFAKTVCWIGIVLSIVSGILLMGASGVVGVLAIIIGSLASWIGSFTLYGFGELIEKTAEIAENTKKNNINDQLETLLGLTNGGNTKITESDKNLLSDGGWKCDCGKVQAKYVSSCSCGRSKRDVLASREKS